MTTHEFVKIAALENQAFGLMGRLHVTMRRHSNRVTDIEYMRINPDYCRHLIDLAMQSQNEDLQNIGSKLQEIYFGENGLFVIAPPKPPLIDRRKNIPVPTHNSTTSAKAKRPSENTYSSENTMEINRHYVGSLR